MPLLTPSSRPPEGRHVDDATKTVWFSAMCLDVTATLSAELPPAHHAWITGHWTNTEPDAPGVMASTVRRP
jgi:hypothetical protein